MCLFWWLPLIRRKSNSETSDMEIPRKYYLQNFALFLTVHKAGNKEQFICVSTMTLKWHPTFALHLSWQKPPRHPDSCAVTKYKMGARRPGIWYDSRTLGLLAQEPGNAGDGCFWSSDKPSHYEWVVSTGQATPWIEVLVESSGSHYSLHHTAIIGRSLTHIPSAPRRHHRHPRY